MTSLDLSRGLSLFQDDGQRRREVGRDIVAAGLLRGDYVLASGEQTNYFLDKHLFLTKPTVLRRLADLMRPMLPADVDRIAAAGAGASWLAAAIALESGLPFVSVEQAGSPSRISGEAHPGESMVVIEDVVATGTRALGCAAALRLTGIHVRDVVAVVDRAQGAARALEADDLTLTALFSIAELAGPSVPAGSP